MKSILFVLTLVAFFNPIAVMANGETSDVRPACTDWANNRAKDNAIALQNGTKIRDEKGNIVVKSANGT